MDLVRWKEEDGAIIDLEINSNRTHKWIESAIRLQSRQRDTQSTSRENQENVDNVSDSGSYPKFQWELNNLLEDVNLSEIAEELSRAE